MAHQPLRWLVLALTATCLLTLYFCFELPSSLQLPLREHMNLSLSQFTLFFCVYSLVNVPGTVLGGHLVDRFSPKFVLVIFMAVMFVGQTIFAISVSFNMLWLGLLGRALFGTGAETFGVAQSTLLAGWFHDSSDLALAMGVNLSTSRLGAVLVDCLAPLINNAYGPSLACWAGTALCLISVLFTWILAGIDSWAKSRDEFDSFGGGRSRRATVVGATVNEDSDFRPLISKSVVSGSTAIAVSAAAAAVPRRWTSHRDNRRSQSSAGVYGSVNSGGAVFDSNSSALASPRQLFPAGSMPVSSSNGRVMSVDSLGGSPQVENGSAGDSNDGSPAVDGGRDQQSGSGNASGSYWAADHVSTSSPGTETETEEDARGLVRFSDIARFRLPFWLLCGATVCFYGALMPFMFIAGGLLQDEWGYSTRRAGLYLAVPYAISAVGSPIMGAAVDRLGRRSLLCACSALLLCLMHVLLYFGIGTLPPLVPLAGIGISYMVFASACWPAVTFVVAQKRLGTAYGVIFSIQNLILTIVPLVLGFLKDTTSSFRSGELVLAIISATAFVLCVFLIMADRTRGQALSMPTRQGQYTALQQQPDYDHHQVSGRRSTIDEVPEELYQDDFLPQAPTTGDSPDVLGGGGGDVDEDSNAGRYVDAAFDGYLVDDGAGYGIGTSIPRGPLLNGDDLAAYAGFSPYQERNRRVSFDGEQDL